MTEHFSEYIRRGLLPGLAAVVLQDDSLLYHTTMGYRNLAKEYPVDNNTYFRLASLTKVITSVAVLQLVERGKLSLDDSISRFIPEFAETKVFTTGKKPSTPITIRHLLNHTSGLSSGLEQNDLGELYRERLTGDVTTLDTLVSKLAALPLCAEPGTKFTYSHGPDVLARVVEIVSGIPFDQYLNEYIFVPLDMTHTQFFVPEEEMDQLAQLYVPNESGELTQVWMPDQKYYHSFPRGNTGLVSTITDFTTFCQMLMNGGSWNGTTILSPTSLQLMTTNSLPDSALPVTIGSVPFPGIGFGLGVSVSLSPNPLGKVPGTFGWVGATHTSFFIDPTNRIAGILFSHMPDMSSAQLIFEYNNLLYLCLSEKP
ncbi:MAG: serine hydrolase domain-containing protein [Candidatus Kapaibacterium sp.]